MCALAEKKTIDVLIDGGPTKSGDFDYNIMQGAAALALRARCSLPRGPCYESIGAKFFKFMNGQNYEGCTVFMTSLDPGNARV